MSTVFLTSDTHFFHPKILEFEAVARPFSSVEEMNEKLVENWNRVVTKRDTVWHLGDVCFGPVVNLQILKRLNGTKNLILGNHDQYGVRAYAALFNKIEACKKYDGFLLSHIPIHPDQFHRFGGNVHGHLHSKVVETWESDYCCEECESHALYAVPDLRYVNVSCEHTNLTPIEWSAVKEKFK